MNWKKLGLIFKPDNKIWWMQSHAALPTPLQLEDSLYRIYFASRDKNNRSHIGYFDIDINTPETILRVSEEPILAPGSLGFFDDHGVYAASAVKHEEKVYLYTIGWNPGSKPPLFYASIGLAISDDGGESFTKFGLAPILARSDHDPCLVTSPVVLKENKQWRMWYVSGYHWDESGSAPQSHYHIKYAQSEDGLYWKREGIICLDHQYPGEKNIARACVYQDKEIYHAWYSYDCGSGYLIGYAESTDGIQWIRKDSEAGINISNEGWDSKALAYPFVIKYKDQLFMFYNGNQFGHDGIGLAVSESL